MLQFNLYNNLQIVLAAFAVSINCGIIHNAEEINHGKATSYQSFKLEHYHPVSLHSKDEEKHLLEHPVLLGQSTADLEVHHGGKHDHGFGVANTHSSINHHGVPDSHQTHVLSGGHASTSNHEISSNHHLLASYETPHENYQALAEQALLAQGHVAATVNQADLYDQIKNNPLLHGYQDQHHDIGHYADASSSHYQVSEGESHVQGS